MSEEGEAETLGQGMPAVAGEFVCEAFGIAPRPSAEVPPGKARYRVTKTVLVEQIEVYVVDLEENLVSPPGCERPGQGLIDAVGRKMGLACHPRGAVRVRPGTEPEYEIEIVR